MADFLDSPLIYGAAMSGMKSLPANPLAQMQRLRAIRYMAQMGNMRLGPSQGRPQATGAGMSQNPLTANPAMFDDPTFRAKANEALGQYGLSMPDHMSPFAYFPETQLTMAHPKLFGAIESGMFGLANTDTSGSTIADQIGNGIRGALGGIQQRNQALMNPYMAPFAMAQQMETLRDLNDQHQLRTAQTRVANANADYAEQKPELAKDKLESDEYRARLKYYDAQTKALEREAKVPSSRLPYFRQLGIDPDTASPADWMKVNKAYQQDQIALAGGRAAAGINAGLNAGTRETVDDKNERTRQQRVDSFIEKTKPSWWAINAKDLPLDASPADKRSWLEKNFNSLSPSDQSELAGPNPTPKKGAAPTSAGPTASATPQKKLSFGELSKQAAISQTAKSVAANAPHLASSPVPSNPVQPYTQPPASPFISYDPNHAPALDAAGQGLDTLGTMLRYLQGANR